jgi:hypothetical protein
MSNLDPPQLDDEAGEPGENAKGQEDEADFGGWTAGHINERA